MGGKVCQFLVKLDLKTLIKMLHAQGRSILLRLCGESDDQNLINDLLADEVSQFRLLLTQRCLVHYGAGSLNHMRLSVLDV